MNVFSFGLRNLQRNRRRTAISILSIALGLAAIATFAGYTKTVNRSLEQQAIYGELLGHLTISIDGFYEAGRLDPGKYLFSPDQLALVSQILKSLDPNALAAPRLGVSGLLSNGKVSTIFVGESLSPENMQSLRGPRVRASGMLDGAIPTGVTVARGLAAMMRLADGADASILTSTISGQANAVDVQIVDTFSTGNIATEDKAVYLPLTVAQTLLDAEGQADRVTVLLPDAALSDAMKSRLQEALAGKNLSVTVRTWKELSAFYTPVKQLFDRVFAFLLTIVLIIVAMSVANAMGMNVVERTREIGTLRAIGMRRSGIVRLFLAEAVLLVAIGCAIGTTIAIALSQGINAAQFAYKPPNATESVFLFIDFDGLKALAAAVVLCLLGTVASLVPARRAARKPIVESLIHI